VVLVDARELLWQQATDDRVAALVTAAVGAARRQQAVAGLGLSPAESAALLANPNLASRSVEPVDPRRSDRVGAAMVGLILLYLAILSYGAFVMYAVIEEKSSRVVEVLLARIGSRELLAGKILGMGVLGLGQVALVILVAVVALKATGRPDLTRMSAGMAGSLVLWFLLGFGLYSVIYGCAGALVSRQEDAQSMSLPLVGVVVIGYVCGTAAAQDPNSALAVVTSFLPPTAPFVMPVRSALADLAVWEVPLAVALTVAAIFALVRLGGRVYAGALLRIGPRVKVREAWRLGAG
jgi:ABC-2 type transport system permease protein